MLNKFKSQVDFDFDSEGDSIMLRHRAGSFIDLLRTSALAGKDVVWGV